MNIYDRIINILLESRIEDYLERLDETKQPPPTKAQRAKMKQAGRKGRLGKADPVPMHVRLAVAREAEGKEYKWEHGDTHQSDEETGQDSFESEARARRAMRGSKLPLPK
jgi:hypothetical protein